MKDHIFELQRKRYSLVGRALHQYGRGHGFNSHSGLNSGFNVTDNLLGWNFTKLQKPAIR